MKTTMRKNAELVSDVRKIILEGMTSAAVAVGQAAVKTYWKIGRRIVEEEQNGERRAEYGTNLLQMLSVELTREFGDTYTARDLRNYRQFYCLFPDFEIWYACVPNLRWTHYRSVLNIEDDAARYWYVMMASKEGCVLRLPQRHRDTEMRVSA